MNIWHLHTSPKSIAGFVNRIYLSPEFAYDQLSSCKLNKKGIELAKKTISKDADYSLKYARNILKYKRFRAGEEAIAKSDQNSYYYAEEIICGRWHPGEIAISKSPGYSFCYAAHVIKKRFPLGEDAIKNSEFSTSYHELLNDLKNK